MTIWETELMEESARNQQWEEINDTEAIEARYQDFTVDMRMAIDDLDRAVDWLETAADGAEGLPAENKILSSVDDLNDFASNLRILLRNLKNGWEE